MTRLQWDLLCTLLLITSICTTEAYFKEKKLAKLLLLGAALAPRGFMPIPVPEYDRHHTTHEHHGHKVVHVHHGPQGHHGYGYGHPGIHLPPVTYHHGGYGYYG